MSFFWKGMALPWKGTLASLVEEKSDEDILSTSVQMIVLTALGERVMYPEFGSQAPFLVFEPNNPSTVNRMRTAIQDALNKWDDRVSVQKVEFESVNDKLSIRIFWKRKKFGSMHTEQVQFMFESNLIEI